MLSLLSFFIFQLGKYVDEKVDKAENILKSQKTKAQSWYSKIIGEEEFKLQDIHIFIMSFAVGASIGFVTS